MKTAVYVDVDKQKEFTQSIERAASVDPRLTYSALGRVLHRSHGNLSQIRTQKAQLPVAVYETWFKHVLPKINERLAEYEAIGIDKMREFDSKKFENSPNQNQVARAIGQKKGIVRAQLKSPKGNRYIVYNLYDFFTNKTPYIKLFPELTQKKAVAKPLDSTEIMLAQTNEQLRRLSSMGVVISAAAYLITGNEHFYISFDKRSMIQRDKFRVAIQTLDDLKEFTECCRQWFTRLRLQPSAEELELKSGKTLLELQDDCTKYLNAPGFLNAQINAKGSTPPIISRGKALTILGMERFVELKQMKSEKSAE